MANENQMVVKVKVYAENLPAAGVVLREIKGVDKVEQIAPQRLRITYDVNRIGWATLRTRLQSIGAYAQTGWFARWRDSWREFIEQNMRANLQHRPACCSKPPAGAGLRSRTHRN